LGYPDRTMAGQIRRLIDELVTLRSDGRDDLRHFVKAHLVMRGIYPDKYDDRSVDDPETLERVRGMLDEARRQVGGK